MNNKIANALFSYFETLYDLDCNIITLCGLSGAENYGRAMKLINDSVYAIPRLVPYKYNKAKEQYVICSNDGLLEYASEMPFLGEDYNYLLEHHLGFLSKVIKIRNKLEHKMHAAELKAVGSGSMIIFEFEYSIDGVECQIYANEMIGFIDDLNRMFSRIQELLSEYVYKEGKEHYLYYTRLLRYDFLNFNRIYNCDLLRIIGKTLLPF